MPRVVAPGGAAAAPAADLLPTAAAAAVSRAPSLGTPLAMARHVTDARRTSLRHHHHQQQQCEQERQQQHEHERQQHARGFDHSGNLHIASAALTAPSSSQSASRASTPTARSCAKYIHTAKRHHAQASDQRASTCSTASTMSSSTRASEMSSVSSASSSSSTHSHYSYQMRRGDSHRGVAASRRRQQLQRETVEAESTPLLAPPQSSQQQLAILEQDPDYLPIDSTQYKHEVTQKKKRRARRIKLKHYGLAKQAAKLNNLSGFLLHSITPRESSILTYTSMASPGTHTEYDIVVENVRTGMIWQVSRRYSTFRLLREELIKPFQTPHCHYCSAVMRDMQKLEKHFPGKRLWGSTSPSVVKARAERFQRYLHGLMDVATSGYKLNCRIIAGYFVVQLRNFLTTDSVRYKGIPGAFGEQIPCLLRELSTPRSPHDQMTLQTIQEHSSRSSRGSLFDDVDAVDAKDFRDKLRVAADDNERQYLQAAAASFGGAAVRGSDTSRSSESVSPMHGFGAYLREEDEFDDDDDDDSDDDDSDGDEYDGYDDDDDDSNNQQHAAGRSV